jgi:hypothetical protein
MREEEERLIGGSYGGGMNGGEDGMSGGDLPPEWVDLKDRVDELVEGARSKSESSLRDDRESIWLRELL